MTMILHVGRLPTLLLFAIFTISYSFIWTAQEQAKLSSQTHKSITNGFPLYASTIKEEKKKKKQQLLEKKTSENTLRFSGDLSFISDSLPNNNDDNAKTAENFLLSEDCRRLLLGAGGTREVERLPETSQLQRMWKETISTASLALKDKAAEANNDNVEYYSTDTVINFPGLTLTNTVVNGFIVVNNSNNNTEEEGTSSSSPECISLLIGEKRKVTGQRGLVWIFNKLSGDDDATKKNGEYSKPQANVVTQSTVIETNNKDGKSAPAFQSSVEFQVLIDCPKAFIRFLPVSKTRMESQGSSAIQRAMSKDFQTALQGVRKGFLKRQKN